MHRDFKHKNLIDFVLNQPELIVLLQQGDEIAFKELVQTYEVMVYNTTLAIVQNETVADDITQEVFIQVYQSISSFKGESKLSTWLYRIAITKSLDYLKHKKRKKRFAFVQSLTGSSNEEEIHPPEFNHPGIVMEQKENAKALFMAMNKLPNNQRIAFTLHKLEALKHQEIAAVMQVSVQAVESLIARAKTNLRKILKTYFENSNA
jgi:RNA polymerase sigma factor (sigma-70 family)